jgi:hypothetical protein
LQSAKKHSAKKNNKKQVSTKIVLTSQSKEEETQSYFEKVSKAFRHLSVLICWYIFCFLLGFVVRLLIDASRNPYMKMMLDFFGIPDVSDADIVYKSVSSPFQEARDYFKDSLFSQSGGDLDEEETEYFKKLFGDGKQWFGNLIEYVTSKIDFDVDKHYTTLGYLRACKLTKQLQLIFDILVSLEILENFSIKIKGYEIFTPSKLGKKIKPFDLFDACFEFCSSFVKACWAFPKKG